MNGYLIVAADYDGDTQVSVKYEIDHHRTQNHYCYKGIDNRSAFIGAGNGDYANTEELYGDMVYAFNFPPDAGTVNEPYGVTIPVTKTNETAYLVLPNNDRHYVYRKFTGTKAEYDTGELNPDDVIAYFEFFLAVYPHVLDIRQPYMAAFIDHVVYQGYEETLKNRYRMEQYFDGKAEEYIPIAEIQDAQASVPFIYVGFDFTKVWADTEAIAQGEYVWETPDVVEYVVLDGRWYMEGMSEVEWPSTVPNPADYRRNSLVVKLDTHMDTVHEILQSVLNGYRNLGSGVDDFGNRALSLEYRDDKGDAKYFNYLEDGDLDLLTGATGGNTRYFNIGVS
jgi:hypothetical protein